MKRQIRQNVFETNSSSLHSLVVKKHGSHYSESELRKDLWLSNAGEWRIWYDDDLSFGRSPFGCLNTFESKVRYAIASLCGYRNEAEEVFEDIAKIVYEVIPECTNIKLPKVRYYGGKEEQICYGYVDEDILTGFLEDEKIDLKEFLTNKKYVVIVDGDEYCIWSDIKRRGLVDKNEIDSEYPARKYPSDEDDDWD